MNLNVPIPHGPRHAEEPPFKELNSNETINPGSYRTLAGISTVEHAQEILFSQTGQVPPIGQVKYLARILMCAADTVQARMRDDGQIDRMAGSHTRARGAVRSVTDMIPPPVGGTPADRETWLKTVIDRATEVIQVGTALAYETFNPVTPEAPAPDNPTDNRSVA